MFSRKPSIRWGQRNTISRHRASEVPIPCEIEIDPLPAFRGRCPRLLYCALAGDKRPEGFSANSSARHAQLLLPAIQIVWRAWGWKGLCPRMKITGPKAPWSAVPAAAALECGCGSDRRGIRKHQLRPAFREIRSSPWKGGSFAAALHL